MAVQVTQLTKEYGSQKAVNEVSFEVGQGEVLGFLGPNGAGKSTTMKIITCFIPQTSGTVTVGGFDTRTDAMEVRKRVGYLPENTPLYFDMYVKEYLQFVARVHKVDNAKASIAEMIDLTGLGREQHKKIGQLSKGYKQRVGIAQAMLHNPDVLILDEPTAGLDPNQLVDIRALIKEVGREKTVILSTHIMQEVQAMCNRVVIINKGGLVANDTPDNLQARMSGATSVLVEFKEKVKVEALSKIKGVKEIKPLQGNSYILLTDKKLDLREEVFLYAKNQDLTLLTLQQEQSSLEDVFHKLTS